jgi:hypothetical protein
MLLATAQGSVANYNSNATGRSADFHGIRRVTERVRAAFAPWYATARTLHRGGLSVSRYPVSLDRGHFSSIGGSCHEEEEALVPSDVVDFSIVARQHVHYRAGPEFWSDGSEGDEVV